MEKKRLECGFAGRLFICAVIITCSIALGNQSNSRAENPSMYELKLDGENIEKLILKSDNKEQTFDKPGKSIMLEHGTYQVSELQLKGRFIYYPYRDTTRLEPIQIGPSKPAILKVGAPLEQRITVQRKGQLLAMDYRLIGISGEGYRWVGVYGPAFKIYKGDKEIASGKFRFG